MTDHQVTLLVAGIGILSTFGAGYFGSWLTMRHARKNKSWELDLEMVRRIEEFAGRMTEILEGHDAFWDKTDDLREIVGPFVESIGKMRRYEKLCQSMREFKNAVDCVYDAEAKKRDDREDKANLRKAFKKLSEECALVVKGKGR